MRIKRTLALIMLAVVVMSVAACNSTATSATSQSTTSEVTSESESTLIETTMPESDETETTLPGSDETEATDMETMVMTIGDTPVDVTWEDNASVEELKKLAASGLTIQMSMYGGFEQVGSIGQSITSDDEQITTEPGDIVLYSGDQIVVFYGSNSWSYTRLGKINLTEKELEDLLSNGDVTITISLG